MANIPFKVLHQFDVHVKKEIEREESSVNESGDTVIVKKKELADVPTRVLISKPTRKQIDAADLYYSIEIANGVKQGLLTRSQISKRYIDDDGVLAHKENKRYHELLQQAFNKQLEFQNLAARSDEKKSEEDKEKLSKLAAELVSIRQDIQELESYESEAFKHSAEDRARTKSIIWYILTLSYYINDKDEVVPLFSGKALEEKMESYYEQEENGSDFYYAAAQKLAYFISFYYAGRAVTSDDFEALSKELDAQANSSDE